MSRQNRQKGGSGIGMVITLAILGYGVYIAIQYVPMHIKSNTIDSILKSVVTMNNRERLGDIGSVQGALDKQIYINHMGELKNSFSVRENLGQFVIKVHYDRELNLLFDTKPIPYDKTVTLD